MEFVQRLLLKTIEIQRLVPKGNSEVELTAKIEIFETAGKKFTCNVWFLECYRILPTCVVLESVDSFDVMSDSSDKSMYTLEESLDFDDWSESSADDLEQRILRELDSLFIQER